MTSLSLDASCFLKKVFNHDFWLNFHFVSYPQELAKHQPAQLVVLQNGNQGTLLWFGKTESECCHDLVSFGGPFYFEPMCNIHRMDQLAHCIERTEEERAELKTLRESGDRKKETEARMRFQSRQVDVLESVWENIYSICKKQGITELFLLSPDKKKVSVFKTDALE